MIRKFTSMGLALVAALALSAVMASGALAAEFHSEIEHTILSGSQTTSHKFKASASGSFGAVSCATAKFSGTSSTKTNTTQTITPEYSNCTDTFGRTVDVAFNGCDYLFHINTSTADLQCPEGADVTLKITGSGGAVDCDVTLQAQTGINGQSFASNAGKTDVVATANATNVTTTTTSTGGLGCGTTNATHTDGTYTGTTTLTGANTTGGAANIWAE